MAKTIHTNSKNNVEVRAHWSYDAQEFRVRLFIDGAVQVDATYHTTDRDDAIKTADDMLKRAVAGKQIEKQACSLTEKEITALAAIFTSEYQDGNRIHAHVWTSYCNPFKTRKTFSGVIASLVKKSLVVTGGDGSDALHKAGCDGTTLALTPAGVDAFINTVQAKTIYTSAVAAHQRGLSRQAA